MSVITQPLSNIIPVTVVIAPTGSPGLTFNQGLIVGNSTVIPSQGSNGRLRQYTSLAQMVTDGFLTSSPEYIAASIYVGQTPAPKSWWIGRQDATALLTAVLDPGNGGTGYVVNDILTVVQSGASAGQVKVTAVASGVVTSLAVVSGFQGTGYSVASGLATTGGTGTGCLVNITAVGETALQAVTACRIASPAWYPFMVVSSGTIDTDYLALAQYAESATPPTIFFLNSSESAIVNGQANNLFAQLQALNYRRTFMLYSTTQGGTFPNNAYAAAGPMGRAMGLNSGAAASYFDIMYKSIAGVAWEPLTSAQLATITGTVDRSQIGYNGNVLANYQNGAYIFIQNGTMANGSFLDQTIFLDMLVAQIQTNGMNLLTSVSALPITSAGVALMNTAIANACVSLQGIGFIAPAGTWTGVTVGSISAGTPLPKGYYVYSPGVDSLTPADRAARKLPPVNVLLIEAQSAHSVAIQITVQQ